MIYHGLYVKLSRNDNILREDKNGNQVACKGYLIEIFSNETEEIIIDLFNCAVGYEIMSDILEVAKEFARDVIDSEEKLYQQIIKELTMKIKKANL